MNLWYSILIVAKLQAFANCCVPIYKTAKEQAFANAFLANPLICHECKNCQPGIDKPCGEKQVFKCEKCEPGELKSCENTNGHHASCVTFYDANGTQIINRCCQIMSCHGLECLIPKAEVKCVSSIMKI